VNHKAEWTVPLRSFMQRVPQLRPELQFVLHTGDITDGRSKEVPRLSAPALDDWRAYRQLLDAHNLSDPLFWLDMRGNHDVYNPPGTDLFRMYSNSGNASRASAAPLTSAARRFRAVSDRVAVFELDVVDAAHTFAFVLFDTCQDNPPIGTMFNFLAYADAADVASFRSTLESLSLRTDITALFAAIHYTSNMVHPLGDINRAMHENGVLARFSGHLHLEHLHSNDDGSMLDLELADLKEKAAFRLVAFDRGLLSFVDAVVTAPVVALVTSPKRSQYITRNDNLPAMATRAEVRLLLFGADEDAVVRVAIDGLPVGTALRSNTSRHFYTMPYDPKLYASHTHVLAVTVDGVSVLDDHEFSLDGTKSALRSSVGPLADRQRCDWRRADWRVCGDDSAAAGADCRAVCGARARQCARLAAGAHVAAVEAARLAVAHLLSGGLRRLPAAAAALLRPPQRGHFRLHSRQRQPHHCRLCRHAFCNAAVCAVCAVAVVLAALGAWRDASVHCRSSAVQRHHDRNHCVGDLAVGRRRDFEQCRALLGRRERSAGTKGLDLETWNNQSQSNKCKWNN
jgi:hypothetical protein